MKLELVDGSDKHRLTIFSTLLVESPYLFKGPIMWRLPNMGMIIHVLFLYWDVVTWSHHSVTGSTL
jgi:hypothetical protein